MKISTCKLFCVVLTGEMTPQKSTTHTEAQLYFDCSVLFIQNHIPIIHGTGLRSSLFMLKHG